MPPSDYQTVVYSPSFVAYNPKGARITIISANGTRFAFNSIMFSSAWRDDPMWSIYGF